MGNVYIIDTTLREGNQTPGVHWNTEDSGKIALLLKEVGVDTIEAGHPVVSREEVERVRRLVKIASPVPVLAHARALIGDVEAVTESGAAWVGIFAGINEITQVTRMRNQSVEEILRRIRSSVTHAKSRGLKVRYTVEDASRTPADKMLVAYQAAVEAGADRICFPDTVGILTPDQTRDRVAEIKRAFPGIPLEVHFHNDRGLAMANALSAVKAGAEWISSSVNGIGERCGITETCALIANLAYSGRIAFPASGKLVSLSETVAALSGIATSPIAPIVGRNAFRHSAKLHVTAVKRSAVSYQWLDPELLGHRMEVAETRSQVMNHSLAIALK